MSCVLVKTARSARKVRCSNFSLVARLIIPHRRHSDFLSGLPAQNPLLGEDLDSTPMCPADHLRLLHSYVTSTKGDGGLGVSPLSEEWDRVESAMALHDHLFNETWIRSWTSRQLLSVDFAKVKEQVSHSKRPDASLF